MQKAGKAGMRLSGSATFSIAVMIGAYAPVALNLQTGMPSFLALSARFS